MPRLRPRNWLILLCLLLHANWVANAKTQKLAQLQKITVGPFDNFQAAVSDDESTLFYTRSQNLSSQIIRLDLKSGLNQSVTEADTDAKAPALSSDNKTLAFTYYRKDAKGDVCILSGKDIDCLTGPGLAEHSPFWVDGDTLAYVQSNDSGTNSKLLFRHLKTKKSEMILEGAIYSPSLAKDGHTLVYKGRGNDLVLYDINARKSIRTLNLNLAGATGPARFSEDNRYLYFSQYMIDSNRDLRLDGRDTAAIFRILIDGGSTEPEQLTSLQQNCSYPYPTSKALYMTCAFEGALDVYRTALSGIVPTDWSLEDLWEAHRAARSYSDRILILNHLYGRLKTFSETEFYERNFSNFILLGAWLPAQYYAGKLSVKQPIYGVHNSLLTSYANWEVLPKKENLGAFSQLLEQQRNELKSLPDSPLRLLASGYLDFFANKPKEAALKAEHIVSSDALTLFWQTQLLKLLQVKQASGTYQEALEKRIVDSNLGAESRLYYLSRWLELLPLDRDPAEALAKLKTKVSQDAIVVDLLEHEQQLFRLVQAADKKATIEQMRSVVDRVTRLKDNYFGMRLLFNRSMIVLYQAKKSRDLSTIMSLWLTYVKTDTKEYPFAIEALRQNSLDMAYRFYHSPNAEKKFAAGSFLDSIRTSDDLESHYQYALLNFAAGPWAELSTNYQTMQRDGLIKGESMVFVETLRRILLDPDKVKMGDLTDAVERIEPIKDEHIGAGAKYLFLGYLYHRQLLLSAKGFKFDRDLADRSHRSYLFAIDAAWNNDRIKASALQNLGLLHSELRNFSLSAEFLQKRQELNFPSPEVQQAVLWLEAKAMYRSYRAADALKVIDEALQSKPQNRLAFLEKKAFYAWNAQEYEVAVKVYEELLPALGSKAAASLYLSQGFALSKLQKFEAAEQSLLKAISLSEQEKEGGVEGAVLRYQPLKIRFTAVGLLAHLKLTITKLISYQQQRLALFPKILDRSKVLHFQDETLSSQRIKETLDLAMLQIKAGQKPAGLASLHDALLLTQTHGKAYGYLAHTVFVSLKNVQLLVLQEQLDTEAKFEQALQASTAAADKEFTGEKNLTPAVRQKWAEVQLINLAFRLRQKPDRQQSFKQESESFFATESPKALQNEKPLVFAELQSYRDGVLKSLR